MKTAVMSKDIPKAELTNEAYNAAKKIIQSIKSKIQASPKKDGEHSDYMRNYMKEFDKLQKQKSIQLRSR